MKVQNNTLSQLDCVYHPAETRKRKIYDWIGKWLNKLVLPGSEYMVRIK